MSSLIDCKQEGILFNIQKYSVHDGPGIRTVVFLKGCPLRCHWCSNPESQDLQPQLAYNSNKCIGLSKCGVCIEACPEGAISWNADDKVRIRWDQCKQCLLCTELCPSQALNQFGKSQSVQSILKTVEHDSLFYARSGGGLTISGGEPFAQPDFCLALLREANRRRINTAAETCGYVRLNILREACQLLDSLLFDIKTVDARKHKACTGASNDKILHNLLTIRKEFPRLPILVRTPLIPGFNDTETDISAILDFIRDLSVGYELLPYHRLGTMKYRYIGREDPMGEVTLPDETIFRLMKLVQTNCGKSSFA